MRAGARSMMTRMKRIFSNVLMSRAESPDSRKFQKLQCVRNGGGGVCEKKPIA
jgi:hypothetical protein